MQPSQLLLTPRIMWFAMLVSTGMYAVILQVVHPASPVPPPPVMLYALAGAAAVVAVMSFVLPKIMQQAATRSRLPEVDHGGSNLNAENFRSASPGEARFVDPNGAFRTALQRFTTPFIISVALSEAVALFGFVIGFLGGPVGFYAPMMAAGAALIAIRFPTFDRVAAPIERATGARFPRT